MSADVVMLSSGDGGSMYTQEELEGMTIANIKALAAELGYNISGSTKAVLIESFLAEQEAANG